MKAYVKLSKIGMLSFASILLACTHKVKVHNRAELLSYLVKPENGLQKSKEIGNVKLTITYHPWDLMLYHGRNQIHQNSQADTNTLKSKLYFILGISSNHKELLRQLPFSDYSEMVQVLSFRMRNFVSIIPDNGLRLEPDECIFEQTYGASTENEVMLVFNKSKLKKAMRLKLYIKEFGLNIGDVSYELNMNDIENTPLITNIKE